MQYPPLDEGFVERIHSNQIEQNFSPVKLQLLHIKFPKVFGDPLNFEDEIKIVLSDGKDIIPGFLPNNLKHTITPDNRFSIVEISSCGWKQHDNKKCFFVYAIKLVAHTPGKIGSPSDRFLKKATENPGVGSANRNLEQNQNNHFKAEPVSAQNNNNSMSAHTKPAFAQNLPAPQKNPFQSRSSGHQTDAISISELNPFSQKTVIQAMVSLKGELRTYKNAKGEGKLVNVHFIDDSGEIRATAFNNEVDRLYDLLEVGKMYHISGFKVGTANKRFSPLKGEFEITFNNSTQIAPVESNIPPPKFRYEFVKLADIEKVEVNALIDVIGLVKEVSEIQTINSKATGKELRKREVTLVDDSMRAIRLTLWDSKANTFEGTPGSILACRLVRVGEFQGKNIQSTNDTMLLLDPDTDETLNLQTWMSTIGPDTDFSSLVSGGEVRGLFDAPLKKLNEVKDVANFAADKPEYFTTFAVVSSMLGNFTYAACPKEGCNKKVTPEANNEFNCAKCNRNYPTCNYRYIATCRVCDDQEDIYIQLFDDQAKSLFEIDANEFEQIRLDEVKLAEFKEHINHTPVLLSLMAKRETYNDIERVKYTTRGLKTFPTRESNKHLLESISQYL